MDLLGGISSAEWSSLNGIYSSDYHDHDDQFMAVDHHHEYHYFPAHDCTVPNYPGASNLELPFTIWPAGSDSTIIHDMAGTCNHQHFVSKFCSSQIETAFGYDHPDTLATSNAVFCEDQNTDLFVNIEGDQNNYQWLSINQDMSNACNGEESGGSQSTATAHVVPQLRWERTNMMITVPNHRSNIEDASFLGNSKKRSRSTEDDQDTPKNKRNVKSSKNKKVAVRDNEEDGNAGSGEQYSDASQEEVGGMASSPSPSPKGGAALNLNGKTRATRGSATDPQSVYARKRREKINERLRILQNLVPNGTKVDISTMLEEAVRYVKFLQLQIKLLSSDDLWMYAPLAYNGMDIGLDHLRQLTAPRQ